MALDASIYGAVGRGVKSFADYEAEADARKLNKLQLLVAQQGYDQRLQEREEANALRAAVAGFGADETQNYNALLRTGNVKAAQDYQKGRADIAKARADADKERIATGLKHFETVGQIMGGVKDQASYDMARQQAASIFGPDFASKLDPIYDPNRIAQAQAQAQTVKERLDNEWKQKGYDLNVRQQGEVEANNLRTDARVRSEGAANRAVTMRGQNITRETALQGGSVQVDGAGNMTIVPNRFTPGQPAVATPVVDAQGNAVQAKSAADKGLNDTQAKALLFGTRMREADKILRDLDGKYSPAAINTKVGAENIGGLTGAAASMIGNRILSSEDQRAEQAQRDFINAVLRRESGAAIAQSEFDNAKRQYFPQPDEDPRSAAQKARARQVAIQGLLAEVPEGRRNSIQVPEIPAPAGGPFNDADKERRYQEWKAKQAK